MKKYILGLLVVVMVLGFFIPNNHKVKAVVIVPGTDCDYTPTVKGTWAVESDGKGGFITVCVSNKQKGQIMNRAPFLVSVIEPIASPIPKIDSTIPNQYIFRPYPLIDGLLPATDPVILGHLTPPGIVDAHSQNIPDVPVSIDSNGLVSALFGNGSTTNTGSSIIMWPPTSIFSNVSNLFGTLDSTFQAFKQSSANYDSASNTYLGFKPGINPKWYPLMVSSLPDPTSKIPLTPITINWKAVPGAVAYHFKLLVADNTLGLDTNIPAGGIDIPSTTTRTYTFTGRGTVQYAWTAIPLDGAGQEIIGSEIIENPIATFIQPTQTSAGQYTYKWPTIPGAVRYEIQYALSFGPIPESIPFTNLASFPETTDAGTPITTTSYVLGGPNCTNCNLDAVNEEFVSGFHRYDFANSILASIQNTTGLPYPSLHFRVRGIHTDGTVVRENITPSGIVLPPLPETPYQSGFPVWSRVTGATGYVIDVAENIADFDNLPKLTVSEIPSISVNNLLTKSATVTTNTTPFLLRRIVADGVYEAGKFAVDRFKVLLKQPRVYQGDVNEVSGYYADINDAMHQDPAYASYDAQTDFDNNAQSYLADSASTNFGTDTLDTYYPHVSDVLGIQFVPSTISNQLKFTTNTPITIQNISTGNALLTVTQSTDKKITNITFGVKSVTGVAGSYAFKIVGNFSSSFDNSVNPLTFATIGQLPLLGDLTGKAATEFKELLPGTHYVYRVRAFKDPNPQLVNTGANALVFFPWSTPVSFATSTGVPASITIGSDGTIFESPVQARGLIDTAKPISASADAIGNRSVSTVASNVSQTLNWTAVAGATNYNVNVYDKAGTPLKSYTGVVGTTLNVPGLNASSVYSYDLQASNALGKSAKSQLYSFNTPTIAAVNAISTANIKSYQDKAAAQKAMIAAFNTYRAAKAAAKSTINAATQKSVVTLQAAIKAYTARRIEIQLPATR